MHRVPGNMEALAGFTATAVEALAKEGYCVVQLPLSLGTQGDICAGKGCESGEKKRET